MTITMTMLVVKAGGDGEVGGVACPLSTEGIVLAVAKELLMTVKPESC